MTHCTLALLCVLMVTTAVAMAADKPPLPSPQQLAWQRHEFIAFAHFGMNTFTDREWGDGKEDPKLFNPTDFDAKQWAAVLQEAGVRLLILTAKHHDGFCLWPSKFTEHCVKNCPWRGGRGDVVREVVDALREKKIRVGLYLSPWDRNQPTYGDSAKYNQFFRNQLRELLTNYGVIDEVWFDGACGEGPNGKKQEYDWASYYALIRELQPHALIAICGPDVRWVGNETGVAREDESSVQKRDGKSVWYPAECDVSIRPGWFYHPGEDKRVRSLATLADIYFKSVGRNSVLLLNVPPDRRGRIADADVARLKEFRALVDQLYATDFVAAATVTASSRPDSSGHERQLQGRDLKTSWVPAEDQTTGQVEFDLGRPRTFNVARIQEDISLGERVQAYHVEILDGDKWRTVTAGRVIGHKQLRRFPAVTAQRVRLVIDKAAAPPAISEFGLHWSPFAPADPGGLSDHRPTTASDVHPGTTQPDLKKGDVVFKADFGNSAERDKWSRAAFAKWAEAGPDGSMCLAIDVAAAEKPGHYTIRMPFDLTSYRGAVLFFECRAKAENVTKPPQPYNGVKYMLHYKSAKGEHWNNQNNVYGTFD